MNMKMKMKASKKMGGFMCQSPGATAVVCMTGDHRSVIVPRRPDRTTMLDHHHHHHHARLLKNTNYIRLGGSRNIAPPPPPPPAAPNKITTTLNNNIIIPSIGTSNSDIHHHEDDHKKHIQKIPTAQLAPSNQVFQVVVMRVSLHCQGCAGKLKKHLSKMEGVTSFSIDLETKRVTVMGHVSPVDVLESISKVKKAEFWSC